VKIFSLESKSVLAGWSVLFGFLISSFWKYLYQSESLKCASRLDYTECQKHWDRIYFPLNHGYFYDFAFWVVAGLAVLGLIRHHKRKNKAIS